MIVQHLCVLCSHVNLIHDKNTIKRATQMSGHNLKLHFYMFERSQMKNSSLDCHNVFWNIFH
jgi:hypothetical protein